MAGDYISPVQSNHQRHLFLDFLRIFAMLIVLFFHLKIPGFKYGYFGVDVFFIISGFLITSIINREISCNKQWYIKFIVDRVERIFPPLIIIVFIATIFGLFFLGDRLLDDLAKSGLKSFYAMSNYYFYSSGGYFDLLSTERPLLHTWSLSVELQFYLLWVALFLVVGRKSKRFIVVILIILISLSVLSSLAAVFLYQMERAAFFLMPFRIYEFALGALSFYVSNISTNTTKSKYENQIITYSLVLGCLIYLFVDSILALNMSASLIVFVLIVKYSNNKYKIDSHLQKIISRISISTYTIYLVHFPTIVFLTYFGFKQLEVIFYTILLTMLFTLIVDYLIRFNKKAFIS